MKILTNLDDIPSQATGAVVAIGNFDGVHLGHQALLAETVKQARAQNRPAAVMTFDPHPRSFFAPQAEPFLLTDLETRLDLCAKAGLDYAFVLPFDRPLSLLDGQAFVDKILRQKLAVSHVVVGDGFVFGHQRSGNTQTLTTPEFGLTVMPPVKTEDGAVVSSSAVRQVLRNTDFATATRLLGRDWFWRGKVIEGDKRGRELGYPTANTKVTDYLPLPYGIYAVRVMLEKTGHYYDGVANFGTRPMFEIPEPLLETYIFDFNMEIYGEVLQVAPVGYLRPEERFDGLEALINQMKQDCQQARAVLKSA